MGIIVRKMISDITFPYGVSFFPFKFFHMNAAKCSIRQTEISSIRAREKPLRSK